MNKKDIAEIHPLTDMQEALLIHSLSKAEDQGFLQVKCTYKGQLDIERFKEAWKIVFSKHKALKTSIHWENISKPVQAVHNEVELRFIEKDWSGISMAESREKIDRFIAEDKKEKINFARAPISRFFLAALSDRTYFLLWTCHHIMIDGWSSYHAIEDHLMIYERLVDDNYENDENSPSYFDYLKWVKSQDLDSISDYWNHELKGFIHPTIIGYSGLDKQSKASFDTISLTVSELDTVKIRELVKRQAVTLNTLMQGLWGIVLATYLNRDDVVFGITVNGRTNTGSLNGQDIIGMLMNVLPVRINQSGYEKLPDLLKDLQVRQYESVQYEYAGIGQILKFSNLDFNTSLFDTLYIYQNFPEFKLKGGGLEIIEANSTVTSIYPLTIIIAPIDSIKISIKFSEKVPKKLASSFLKGMEQLLLTFISNESDFLLKQLKDSLELPEFYMEESTNLNTTEDGTNVYRRHQRNIEGTKISKLHRRKESLERDQAPGNTTQLKLSQLWEELFGWYPIGIRENFFDIGGTSLMAVQLFSQVEKFFSINLPTSELLNSPTIEELAVKIDKNDKQEGWGSLVALRKKGSRNPLFCIHAGGAHVLFYQDLARNLGDDQPVYAIQPVGLDGVKKAHESIQEMAAYYIREIRKIQPIGPYALLGTCFSDAVGIEMARQLVDNGEVVEPLIIVDSTPDGEDFNKIVEKERMKDYWDIVSSGNYKFVYWAIRKKLQTLIERIKYSGKSKKTPRLDYSQIGNLDMIRNNMTNLYNKYDWQPFNGKVTYILSDGFGSNPWSSYLIKKWAKIAKKGVEPHKVPGRHFSIFEEPEVLGLAKKIEECLRSSVKN